MSTFITISLFVVVLVIALLFIRATNIARSRAASLRLRSLVLITETYLLLAGSIRTKEGRYARMLGQKGASMDVRVSSSFSGEATVTCTQYMGGKEATAISLALKGSVYDQFSLLKQQDEAREFVAGCFHELCGPSVQDRTQSLIGEAKDLLSQFASLSSRVAARKAAMAAK